MVQLPATAAIEYVAACWVSGAGGFLSGGGASKLIGRDPYENQLQIHSDFIRGTYQLAHKTPYSVHYSTDVGRLAYQAQLIVASTMTGTLM